MMLTTKSRYAVMAIVEVAASQTTRPIKLADISNKQTISLNYLEQIFLKLKKADIVRSVKGPGGGYFLNIPSESLNIIEIIDAVEENTKMTRCSVDKTCRKNGTKCMTHDLWKGLGNQIRNYFSSISVADVMAGEIDFHIVKE
jgi:Rrf2 family transcriptional regulator, iron-sulfur cluster assembly transcription factor